MMYLYINMRYVCIRTRNKYDLSSFNDKDLSFNTIQNESKRYNKIMLLYGHNGFFFLLLLDPFRNELHWIV